MFSVSNKWRMIVAVAGCAALLAPAVANADLDAGARPGTTNLTLINGWTNSPFSTSKAAVETISGIVHFKGAIWTSGTNNEPFVLPAAFRPAVTVYVKVDLCNAHNGRLQIVPAGDVFVEPEGNFSDAQCFTSLDGVSFAPSSAGFKQLNLKHGWTGGPFQTANPAAQAVGGVVHLAGAMSTGKTDTLAFTLPAKFRPTSAVFVPVDMCNATNGRLIIEPTGDVSVQAETDFSNAQCFTSLDGVTFAVNGTGYAPLSLINSWTNAPFGTRNASVRVINGIVQFQGAIATTGTNPEPFVLPSGFRPKKAVYVAVDMCDATNGRLQINPDGNVFAEAESDFANAQCFTSLEGASFHP